MTNGNPATKYDRVSINREKASIIKIKLTMVGISPNTINRNTINCIQTNTFIQISSFSDSNMRTSRMLLL